MKKYITLIVLSLLLISCGKNEKEIAIDNSPAIAVTVSSVNSENSTPFFTASGKIEAIDKVTLSTRTSGFVDVIYVRVGDKVTKGKLLLSTNSSFA